jgi:transcriptional regulator with XRE-family HTH domain
MSALHVRELGTFIRDQRRGAQISLRQLARQAGVSNPYLSQIERGLRKPSAEILQQIAKALRISAEVLYVQAGILDEREADGTGTTVAGAVLRDDQLSERQKQVLLEIYESFRRENDARTVPTSAPAPAPPSTPAPRSTSTSTSTSTQAPVLPVPAAAVDGAVPPAGATTA